MQNKAVGNDFETALNGEDCGEKVIKIVEDLKKKKSGTNFYKKKKPEGLKDNDFMTCKIKIKLN